MKISHKVRLTTFVLVDIITMLYIKVELYLGTDDGTESGGVLPQLDRTISLYRKTVSSSQF